MSRSQPTPYDIELAIRELPAAPRILAQLASRLRSLDVDVSEVTTAVKRDSGLSGVLLNAANSVLYCGFTAATTVEDAVARLGYGEVYRIIGDAASGRLGDCPLPMYRIGAHRLRENSLFCALMMEELAEFSSLDRGTAYTVGLLRSIGKVALEQMAVRRPAIRPFEPHGLSLLEWETANWSTTNPEVAARAFKLWGFPHEVVAAVRDHLQPEEDSPREAHLLHLAASVAAAHGIGLYGEAKYWRPDTETCDRAELDESQVTFAAQRAAELVLRLSPVLA